jgi:hypothetical protein
MKNEQCEGALRFIGKVLCVWGREQQLELGMLVTVGNSSFGRG